MMDAHDGVSLGWSHYATETLRNDAEQDGRREQEALPLWARECLVKLATGSVRRQLWLISVLKDANDVDASEAVDRFRLLREWGYLKRSGDGFFRLSAKGRRTVNALQSTPE